MADQIDQHSDPPADDQTFIPIEKSSVAGKSLPGYNVPAESKSESDSESSDSDDDEEMIEKLGEEFKDQKLNQLRRKSLYSVLHAFRVENLTIGNKRNQIIEKLMKEWKIDQETRISFEEKIQKNLIAQEERFDSDMNETQIVEAKPLSIFENKPTCVAPPRLSWDRVNPEDLVGRRVRLIMPWEDHFEELVIKEYNAKDGMHRLETTDSDEERIDETFGWMDLREVPPEDIIWRYGEDPKFCNTPKT